MFVNKGGQSCVILFVESISFRSKEICCHFLFINFMIFTKVPAISSWILMQVKLVEAILKYLSRDV